MTVTPEDNLETGAEKSVTTKLMPEWDKEPTVAELKQDLLDAQQDHDTNTGKIDTWLDNLNMTGKAKVKSVTGKSSVAPKLIRKQAEWRYSSLSDPFLSTRDLFNVNPVTFEDKESAEQNALVLNNQFNTRIDKVGFIDDYIHTLVDEGTAIVRVGWESVEEDEEVEMPDFELVASPDMASLEEAKQIHAMMEHNPAEYAELPDAMKQAHDMYMKTGTPYRSVPTGETRTVTVTKVIKNQPTVLVCNYRNTIVDPSCLGNLEKAQFIIHSFETSLAELKELGIYKNLETIRPDANSVLAEPDHTALDNSNFQFTDNPRKKMVAYEYWGYRDVMGDGELTSFVATWVGDTMIRLEENPFSDGLPFVSAQYLPIRRSVYGEPDGELLLENQKIVGAITRGMIDTMARSANGQVGIRKDALDVTNLRKFKKGEDYQYNGAIDPKMAFHMGSYPEIPNSAPLMLNMQNAEAESLTGIKAFSQGISGTALGDTATAVRTALDATSKRELSILRRAADGVTRMGRKIMAMNAVFLSEKEVVRITNDKFVTVKRDDLNGSFDLALSISTAEEDNQKASELAFMLQTMGNNMDPKMSSMILADIAKLRKMPDLAKKIEDYVPQPDPIEQEKRGLEIELLRAQIAKEQSLTVGLGSKSELDGAKVVSEIAKANKIDSETDLNNLNFVETETGTKHERELDKAGEQGRMNQVLEDMKQKAQPKPTKPASK